MEKYRPVTLDDVVSHKDITNTSEYNPIIDTRVSFPLASVEKFIEKNRLPHLLFYGPPGTGKTSTILAVARRIYGSEYRKQILEVCVLHPISRAVLTHTLAQRVGRPRDRRRARADQTVCRDAHAILKGLQAHHPRRGGHDDPAGPSRPPPCH